MERKATVGMMLTLFLMLTLFIAFPAKSQLAGTIRIGVIGPMRWTQGSGIWRAVNLAARQINLAGGIKVNYAGPGWTYSPTKRAWRIRVVRADTLRWGPLPTAASGTVAAMMLVASGCDFVIGGASTEATFGAREVLADAHIPFFICGAATNELIDCAGTPATACGACVRDNYNRYKYVFRNTPTNSTTLMYSTAYFLKYLMAKKLIPIYGAPLKIAVISEDLTWADTMHYYLYDIGNYIWNRVIFGDPTYSTVSVVYGARVSPVATTVMTELLAAKAAGAKLIIEVLSGPVGTVLPTQLGALGINAFLAGINVAGQDATHWTATAGACEYETILAASGTATPVTPTAVAFWNAYTATYGTAPVYTSFGAYETVYAIKEMIEAVNKWPFDSSDEMVPHIEKTFRVINRPDVLPPFTPGPAMLGTFKYTTATAKNVSTTPGVTTWQIAPYLGAADSDPAVAWSNFRTAYNATWTNGTHSALDVNPTAMGTLHELFTSTETYSPYWTSPYYTRTLVVQWQAGRLEVVYPINMNYSRKVKIPLWMYSHADTDIARFLGGYLRTIPDGIVDDADMDAVTFAWYSKPGDAAWVGGGEFYGLEADQDGNGVIKMADVSTISKEYGYDAIVEYGQWPLP